MKIFASTEHCRQFARSLSQVDHGLVAGKSAVLRFLNGEMRAEVYSNVKYRECLVVGSVAPPDGQMLATLSLTDALKRNGASKVRGLLPYLGYARQDKFTLGESGGIALVGSLLRAVGMSEIISFDVHSELDHRLVGVPIVSLPTAALFAPAIARLGWDDVTVVAPDEGAIMRAQAIARALQSPHPAAHLVKKRFDGVMHLDLVGKIGARVVIVDDIIDTGKTLVSACRLLNERGAQDIAVAVTHGLFTGETRKSLFDLGVRRLFVTDSCPEVYLHIHPSIEVIPLAHYIDALLPELLKKERSYEGATARS